MTETTPENVTTEIHVGWRPVLSVWWLLTWRTSLYASLPVVLVEKYLLPIGNRWADVGVEIAGYLWFIAIALLVTAQALHKQYKTFRIALVQETAA